MSESLDGVGCGRTLPYGGVVGGALDVRVPSLERFLAGVLERHRGHDLRRRRAQEPLQPIEEHRHVTICEGERFAGRGELGMHCSLLCGAQRPGLSVTPLGANGHCGPKSGSHGMPNTLPACPSLVWGHASRKLHAGMPHHLCFFKRWCPSSRECTPQNRPPQPKKCKQGVGSSRLAH